MKLNQSLLTEVNTLAIAAGVAILQVYNRPGSISVDHKSDDSPLTEADRRAHELIVAGLEALTPDIPVLSEESELIPFEVRTAWSQYWLVDPLDGTKEFIKRNGEFTVNIALIDRGTPVLGVVHVPVQNISYLGILGAGAWKQLCPGELMPIQASQFNPADGKVRVVASRSHRDAAVDELIAKLESRIGGVDVVSMGSSLKICLCAEGAADIYPRFAPTCEWDTGAAHAVLAAAGGTMVNPQFETLSYNQKSSYLNPFFIGLADASYDWQALLS